MRKISMFRFFRVCVSVWEKKKKTLRRSVCWRRWEEMIAWLKQDVSSENIDPPNAFHISRVLRHGTWLKDNGTLLPGAKGSEREKEREREWERENESVLGQEVTERASALKAREDTAFISSEIHDCSFTLELCNTALKKKSYLGIFHPLDNIWYRLHRWLSICSDFFIFYFFMSKAPLKPI